MTAQTLSNLAKECNSDLGVCAVTGSSGWFASSVVAALNAQSYQVIALDICQPQSDAITKTYCDIDPDLTTFVTCDIRNLDALKKALRDVSTVFHVCAITDIRVRPTPQMFDVNVNGTGTLLQACRAMNVKNFVYTSSIEVINDGKPKDQVNEDIPYVYDYNVYGKTKTMAEQLCIKASHSGLAIAALRIAHIFGPGDPLIFATTDIPLSIGDMKCKHSFIYLENCAYAHIATAKALADPRTRKDCTGEVFNIKDVDYNFLKFYREILCEAADVWTLRISYQIAYFLALVYQFLVSAIFKLFGYRVGHPVQSFGVLAVETACQEHTFDCSKFDTLIGYQPPVRMIDAIERTCAWRFLKYPKKFKRIPNKRFGLGK